MLRFRNLTTSDLDVFITSSTFFCGIFLQLVENLNQNENGVCINRICVAYGLSLSITALLWMFLAAFSILYRLHHEKINRIIVVTTHLLMRSSVISSIVSINLNMWYNYENLVGHSVGLARAIFAIIITFIMVVIYLIDLYQYRKKEGII